MSGHPDDSASVHDDDLQVDHSTVSNLGLAVCQHGTICCFALRSFCTQYFVQDTSFSSRRDDTKLHLDRMEKLFSEVQAQQTQVLAKHTQRHILFQQLLHPSSVHACIVAALDWQLMSISVFNQHHMH